jgi:hypothetical protein
MGMEFYGALRRKTCLSRIFGQVLRLKERNDE